MRASTLFGLTIAILIGMAVVFGVKSAGLFDRAPKPVVNVDRPRILAPRTSMFEGLAANAADVIVRFVDEGPEMDHYQRNKHKYMPPIPEAANFRILARHVQANEPLLKEHFKDLGMPPSFDEILAPGMRAVNLQVPAERAGGGIIRKNDHVDVLLTTNICADPSCYYPKTATAPIALGLKVVIKRDSIWTRMEAVDASKPIPFTLEANPYRAALIEFAKNRGMITLVPTGPVINKGKLGAPQTNDGKDEDRRIMDIRAGQPVTDRDLEEIFKVTPIPRGPGSVVTERWSGIRPSGGHSFPATEDGFSGWGPPQIQANDGRSALGYSFQPPSGGGYGSVRSGPPGPGYVKCDTCPGGYRKVGP